MREGRGEGRKGYSGRVEKEGGRTPAGGGGEGGCTPAWGRRGKGGLLERGEGGGTPKEGTGGSGYSGG